MIIIFLMDNLKDILSKKDGKIVVEPLKEKYGN